MYSFTKREQIVILVIAFVVISIFGYNFLSREKEDQIVKAPIAGIEAEGSKLENITAVESDKESEKNQVIMVHISGQVYNPGLLELKIGDRINDAVELSGGLKKDADIDRINLSKKVQDEEKIYIPKIGEDLERIKDIADTDISSQTTGKIDINNCTKESLISLPGIGDATAEKIIKYRQDFRFEKIEDIMNVSGIGEKKFQAIKDSIIAK